MKVRGITLLFISENCINYPLCYLICPLCYVDFLGVTNTFPQNFYFKYFNNFTLTCNNILPFSNENVDWLSWYLFLRVHTKGLSNVTTLSIYSPMVSNISVMVLFCYISRINFYQDVKITMLQTLNFR